MSGNSTHENRETPSMSTGDHPAGRLEKGMSSTSNTHVDGESDGRIVR